MLFSKINKFMWDWDGALIVPSQMSQVLVAQIQQAAQKQPSSEASVRTNMTASQTSSRFIGSYAAALRFRQIPKVVYHMEVEAIWVHCHVQETTLRQRELCDTTRDPVESRHQETVQGGHNGPEVIRNKTQVTCHVSATLTCF